MSKKQSGKIAEFGEYEIHANGVMQDGDFYGGANGFHFLAVRIEKLEAECFALASWQCPELDGKTGLVAADNGSQYCARERRIAELEAENERLEKRLDAYARYYGVITEARIEAIFTNKAGNLLTEKEHRKEKEKIRQVWTDEKLDI